MVGETFVSLHKFVMSHWENFNFGQETKERVQNYIKSLLRELTDRSNALGSCKMVDHSSPHPKRDGAGYIQPSSTY